MFKKCQPKIKVAQVQLCANLFKGLGHIVSANGIDPDDENVEAVRKFPYPPENKKRQC